MTTRSRQYRIGRLLTLGAAATLSLLSGCTQEPPHPTDLTLNLATGCFDSVSYTGQHYVVVGCLNKDELASLKTFKPGSPLAKYTAQVQTEYASALNSNAHPGEVHQPSLNLVTGCFEGPGSVWDFLKRKKCIDEQSYSPRVLLKTDMAKSAYERQSAADREATYRRDVTPSSDFDMTPLLLII